MEVHRPQDLTDGDGDGGFFCVCVCCVKEVAYIFLTDVEPQQNAGGSLISEAVGTPTCLLVPSFLVTWLLSADL